jgi:hypothetical protein
MTILQGVPKKHKPFEIKPLFEFECLITMLNLLVRNIKKYTFKIKLPLLKFGWLIIS